MTRSCMPRPAALRVAAAESSARRAVRRVPLRRRADRTINQRRYRRRRSRTCCPPGRRWGSSSSARLLGRGRNGRRLRGTRHPAGSGRRAQGPARRIPARPDIRQALRDRSAGDRQARTPQHRSDLRQRHRRRHAVDEHAPARRRQSERAARTAGRSRRSRPCGCSGTSPRRSIMRTLSVSCTGTSSRRTSCSTAPARLCRGFRSRADEWMRPVG